jgi:curli biogenesis system outer membrane secretion channel CsgG
MKRITCLACALGLFVATVASAQTPAAQSGPAAGARKKRVAVFDFDYGTVHNYIASIFGSDIDVGKGVSDLLVSYLIKDGTYSVIERKSLDKILAEQNFSNSDRADATSAAKIGKLLGVDAIIVGSITQFGNDTKTTGLGGVGAAIGGFGLGGVNRKNSKAVVALTARIVDIDTAEILAVAEGKGESKRTSTSLTGGAGTWHGFGAGGVNFGSSEFQATIIGEATKLATEQLSGEVIAGNSKLQVRTVVVEGLVAAVEGNQVILNVGSKAGVKAGDQLNIERVSREIKDPASGKVIRRMTSSVGMVRVTEVDADSAVASVVSGTGFKIGDAAKTVTQ